MKIELKDALFQPVCITLETQQEVDLMKRLMQLPESYRLDDPLRIFQKNIFDKLEEMLPF